MTDAAHAEHEVQGLKTFITDWSTDQEAFKRGENRRWELTANHWDLPIHVVNVNAAE